MAAGKSALIRLGSIGIASYGSCPGRIAREIMNKTPEFQIGI
jgi:hypothetical protein